MTMTKKKAVRTKRKATKRKVKKKVTKKKLGRSIDQVIDPPGLPKTLRIFVPDPKPESEDRKVNVAEQLTLDQIDGILTTCCTHNVLSFQYKGLSVTFQKKLDVSNSESEPSGEDFGEMPTKRAVAPGKSQAELQRDMDRVELELEHLKITDPLAYEEFAQSEDAEDDQS